jgi:two-component system CheB/CheR fusion protein
VDDLTDFTRIEQGRLRLHRSEVDLGEVVRRMTNAYAGQDASGRIILELPAESLCGQVDGDRLGQIVANLINNAIRYAPQGEIRVCLRRQGEQALLEVRDHGPGISAEALPRVWELFYRAPEAQQSPVRGAGIGLSLVKNLAEAHGGRVEAESVPGDGAAFRVYLPLSTDGV